MKIEGTPEEIAALVVALQERQISTDTIAENFADRLTQAFEKLPASPASLDTP